jgi:hypothetical protein
VEYGICERRVSEEEGSEATGHMGNPNQTLGAYKP